MAAGPSFRVFGIPVRIEPTFFLIAVLLGFGGDLAFLLVWVAVVTVSVLAHELGHGVAFRAFGKQPEILLQGMGGVTSAPGSLSPARDLVVSLAGPLTGLVLIGLPALWLQDRLATTSPEWDTALRVIVFVNIVWSVINLLPVLPLDGGRVAASGLHLMLGRRADRAAHIVSIVVAAGAGLWAYAEGQVFAALFAGFFVAYNASQLSQMRARARVDDLLGGYRALARGDTGRALEVGRALSTSGGPPAAVGHALELQAWASVAGHRPDEAQTALVRMPAQVSPSRLLTGSIKLAEGRTGEALDDLVQAYERDEVGPWNPVAADLVAGAGALEPLVDRLVASGNSGVEALAQLQSDLHHAGRFTESARVGEQAFGPAAAGGSVEPASVAYNAACSLARAGRAGEAITWLRRAVEYGFADRDLLDRDPDLEPLRATAEYQAVREGIG